MNTQQYMIEWYADEAYALYGEEGTHDGAFEEYCEDTDDGRSTELPNEGLRGWHSLGG